MLCYEFDHLLGIWVFRLFQRDGTVQLFGTAGQAKLFCPGTKGQRDKLKILPRDGTGFFETVPSRPGTSRGTKLPSILHIYAVFRIKVKNLKKKKWIFFSSENSNNVQNPGLSRPLARF